MNQLYLDLVVAQAQAAIAAASSVSRVEHGGLKGQLREIVVRELLRPLLPADYVVGTGLVVSAYREVSKQLDVVACDRRLVPPVLFESTCGIFPLEATLFTVEVKSTLNATELKAAHDSAVLLSKFQHAPPVGSTRWDPEHKIEHVVPYLLAFASDLAVDGKSEIERYDEARGSEEPALRGICVVGRGFWFWSEERWNQWNFAVQASEIVALVASIANICQRISGTRRQPDLRAYLT